MGGDAILHHPENYTRIEAGFSKLVVIRNQDDYTLYLNSMELLPGLNVEEVFQNETVLALSRYRRGHRLDPVSALYQAEDIFNYCGAILPPDNAAFRLVWSLERTIGTTIKYTYVSSIQFRTQFVASLPGTIRYSWKTFKLQRVD